MSKSILDMFEFSPRLDHRDEAYQKLKADYPLLGAALVGSWDAAKKSGFRGATLMLFVDNDQLKFTIHSRATKTTLFGTLPELVLSLEDVEKSLSERRFDAKKG